MHVFISYSSKNHATAEYIKKYIQSNGIPVWMADAAISVGGDFAENIMDALDKSCAFVLILSKDAMSSRWVGKELKIAESNPNIKVFPIQIEECELTKSYKYTLCDVQILYAYKDLQQALDKLVKELKKVVPAEAVLVSKADTAKDTVALEAEDGDRPTVVSKRIEYLNGKVYEGEVDTVSDKPHGKGTMKWPDGAVYIGDFIYGNRTGKGQLTWRNGEVYVGDFVQGKRTGKGRLTRNNGDVYEGGFVAGLMHGQGRYTEKSGNIYIGEYKYGRRTGKGRYNWLDGSECHGDVYEGWFDEGHMTGKGKYIWQDGDYYEGEFVDGLRHGKGVLINTKGDQYKGTFKRDRYYDVTAHDKNGIIIAEFQKGKLK